MDHFFLLMLATSGSERNYSRFQSFSSIQDALDMVHTWLQNNCAMELIPAAEEVEVRAKNGGELPEDAFLCPEIKEPKDLTRYNGFYNYNSYGVFNLFLTPVYDRATAEQFVKGMNKEYGLDQEFSERSDRIMEHLQTFVSSFGDPNIDYHQAEREMEKVIQQDGLSLFPFDEVEIPDTIVLPSGTPSQFDPNGRTF